MSRRVRGLVAVAVAVPVAALAWAGALPSGPRSDRAAPADARVWTAPDAARSGGPTGAPGWPTSSPSRPASPSASTSPSPSPSPSPSGSGPPRASSGGSTTGPSPAPGGAGDAPGTVTARGRTGCASAPGRCGYPDATTAGVRAGVALRKVPQEVRSGPGWVWDRRGWVAVTGDGVVFQGYDVAGTVDVTGDRVTVRDVRVRQAGESFGVALRHTRDVTVEHCDISAPDAGPHRLMVGVKDIYGDATGTRVLGNDIWHTATGIQLRSGLVQGNYVHDLGLVEGDHVNGFTDNGGVTAPLVIRHNTFLNPHPQTDAISLFQDFGAVANRVIDDNLVAGGSYAVYAGGGGRTTHHIRVTNNRFARLYFAAGGRYGAVTGYEPWGTGNVFSGNVWDDTGAPVGH